MDDVIYEIFEPLPQGAPGNEASTLRALHAVPVRDTVRQVLDLGVGHGRTTLTLAKALRDAQVTAVDIHAPFVEQIAGHAREAGVADRVHALCGDMENLDISRKSLDLVWAEGSIYVMGIERALARWRPWLSSGGCVAFSDFVWWTDDRSDEASEFWASEYPDMATEVAIRSTAEAVGYQLVNCFRMPKEAHDAYYLPLEARVAEFAECDDADVQKVLATIRTEIDVVQRFSDEAGYSFFVLQRAEIT
ncbi:MAG: class I SAM-dependent methyltransferase [Proteobacteria bacterium]|nr:class I SAM-dependent methyltransferase [Pseudomonadota bacterium]MYJ94100.1 class I SAM-dependent methyltransferase [Pseudomonadota bacterium]